MKTALEIFEFLPGIWRIIRNIKSPIPKENITEEGVCVFQKAKDNPWILQYSEKVTLKNTVDGSTNLGTQKYQYRYDSTMASISKYFSDGRFFYTLNITDNKIGGAHLCSQDNYLSSYRFSENSFTLTYSVQGPHKCYNITTEYIKLSAEEVDSLGITLEDGEIV